MGEWSATMELVTDVVNGRKLSRRNLLWLAYLLNLGDVSPKEPTRALQERIKTSRAFVGWALNFGCYPTSVVQRARETTSPRGSPKCDLCPNTAGAERVDDETEEGLGLYLCHVCERREDLPPAYEGGTWQSIPFDLPKTQEAYLGALDKIMERRP